MLHHSIGLGVDCRGVDVDRGAVLLGDAADRVGCCCGESSAEQVMWTACGMGYGEDEVLLGVVGVP